MNVSHTIISSIFILNNTHIFSDADRIKDELTWRNSPKSTWAFFEASTSLSISWIWSSLTFSPTFCKFLWHSTLFYIFFLNFITFVYYNVLHVLDKNKWKIFSCKSFLPLHKKESSIWNITHLFHVASSYLGHAM